MPAGEQPVNPDVIPEGGPDELLAFIEDLKRHRPGATPSMVAAAQKILQQRTTDVPQAE